MPNNCQEAFVAIQKYIHFPQKRVLRVKILPLFIWRACRPNVSFKYFRKKLLTNTLLGWLTVCVQAISN